jgi:3-oxoadipate enol-lactonase
MASSDRYFLTAGARLCYRDEGTGPALVLVHGWTLDLEMWNPQADSLRSRFRIIRFDRRGFGLSSGLPDLHQDAADIIALCRHLGVRSVGCVGMSQAARIVLHLARVEPEFVACFVLDGPPNLSSTPDGEVSNHGLPLKPGDLDYQSLRSLAQTHGMEAFRREWARHPLTALETGEPAVHELLERMLARYPGADLLSSPAQPGGGPLSPPAQPEPTDFELGTLTQPALVVNGALDTASRLNAGQTLAQSIPNCERTIVPRARHLPNLDNPEHYNSLLLHFFSRHL